MKAVYEKERSLWNFQKFQKVLNFRSDLDSWVLNSCGVQKDKDNEILATDVWCKRVETWRVGSWIWSGVGFSGLSNCFLFSNKSKTRIGLTVAPTKEILKKKPHRDISLISAKTILKTNNKKNQNNPWSGCVCVHHPLLWPTEKRL